jgi:regulatory protein
MPDRLTAQQYTGAEFTEAEQTEAELRELMLALRRRAMDYLARREHSRFELFNKLSDKFPEASVEQLEVVLDQLVSDRLLSDERFVESYVRGRVGRGYGPLYIRFQLRQRRVAEELIESALAQEDAFWVEALADVVRRKSGNSQLPVRGSTAWLKMQRFVQSRGFTVQQLLQLSQLRPQTPPQN